MKKIQLYADGACQGNPGPGGYGAVLLFGKHRMELSGGFRQTTNNRMEIMGVIKGLEALKEKCEVEIYSDSKYVVDALSKGWAVKWRKKGWMRNKKERALNSDLWAALLALYESHEASIQWVKGHSGNPENERCDQLAYEAAIKPDLPPDDQYGDSVPILIPRQPEVRTPSDDDHSDLKVVQVRPARKELHSSNRGMTKAAIFEAVKENRVELGPDLVQAMKSEKDPNLKSRCAWALGKLGHRDAETNLVAALNDRSEEVRTWSAWALGEIGTTQTVVHLRRALTRENFDDVRRAIGGALKKLNYDTTRTHESELNKALKPPKTQDATLAILVNRLEEPDWKSDRDVILAIRAEMKKHDPDFFDLYMSWVERKPGIIAALEDGRKVYL